MNPVFLVGIVLATLSGFFSLFLYDNEVMPSGDDLFIIIFTLSALHQAASYYLYADSASLRQILRAKAFYLAGPVALFVGTGILYAFLDPLEKSLLILAYGAVTLWHYQKQNYGVFGLVCRSLGVSPPSLTERRLLVASVLPGLIAAGTARTPIMPSRDQEIVHYYLPEWCLDIAFGLYLVIICLVAFQILARLHRSRADSRTIVRALSLLCLSGMFLPFLLMENLFGAFAVVSISHGLQYFCIMAFYASRHEDPLSQSLSGAAAGLRPFIGLSLLAGITYIAWYHHLALAQALEPFFQPLWSGAASDTARPFIKGWIMAFALAHYWIDYRFWRVRDPATRHLMNQKLPKAAARA
jgi:hypothetical protein